MIEFKGFLSSWLTVALIISRNDYLAFTSLNLLSSMIVL